MSIVKTTGSFTIRSHDPEEETMKIKNAVWTTADKKEAVPAGDKAAAFLLVGANGVVSAEVAARYKLTENGAPGQKGQPRPIIARTVNANAPDGVNTHPDSPAARGEGNRTPAPAMAPAPAPKVTEPKPENKPASTPAKPASTPAGETKGKGRGKGKQKVVGTTKG